MAFISVFYDVVFFVLLPVPYIGPATFIILLRLPVALTSVETFESPVQGIVSHKFTVMSLVRKGLITLSFS